MEMGPGPGSGSGPGSPPNRIWETVSVTVPGFGVKVFTTNVDIPTFPPAAAAAAKPASISNPNPSPSNNRMTTTPAAVAHSSSSGSTDSTSPSSSTRTNGDSMTSTSSDVAQTIGVSDTASGVPSPTNSPPAVVAKPSVSGKQSFWRNKGAVIGTFVAVALVVLALAAMSIAFICYMRKRRKKAADEARLVEKFTPFVPSRENSIHTIEILATPHSPNSTAENVSARDIATMASAEEYQRYLYRIGGDFMSSSQVDAVSSRDGGPIDTHAEQYDPDFYAERRIGRRDNQRRRSQATGSQWSEGRNSRHQSTIGRASNFDFDSRRTTLVNMREGKVGEGSGQSLNDLKLFENRLNWECKPPER